jgi:cyclophilin family peptidyl-prolyl cis-trans isomerase
MASVTRSVTGVTPIRTQPAGGTAPSGISSSVAHRGVGAVDVVKGQIQGVVSSPTQKAVAVPSLPKASNAALKHDAAGVVGVSAPNAFYITLAKNAALDRKFTAIGRVIATLGSLTDIKKGDPIRSVRITRVGQAARLQDR